MFDHDQYLDAQEKPSFKVNGKVYTGRLLSVVEAGKFQERFAELDDAPDSKKLLAICKDYLYATFPKPAIPWHVDVAKEIMNSPALYQVVTGFFTVNRVAQSPQSHSMNGTEKQRD